MARGDRNALCSHSSASFCIGSSDRIRPSTVWWCSAATPAADCSARNVFSTSVVVQTAKKMQQKPMFLLSLRMRSAPAASVRARASSRLRGSRTRISGGPRTRRHAAPSAVDGSAGCNAGIGGASTTQREESGLPFRRLLRMSRMARVARSTHLAFASSLVASPPRIACLSSSGSPPESRGAPVAAAAQARRRCLAAHSPRCARQ
mmetsp:Transcript_377/g.1477  ORF Transcript_377/g.1477 Transcript_377/m.1477 type:complete len:205 (-) Transcript_377:276-890(-)